MRNEIGDCRREYRGISGCGKYRYSRSTLRFENLGRGRRRKISEGKMDVDVETEKISIGQDLELSIS